MKNLNKSNHQKNEIAQSEKLLRDLDLYQKIFLQTKYENKKQQSISIRRLLPNKQFSQHQQQSQQLFSHPSLQCFNTQLDQETSYSHHQKQEKRRKKIAISMIDCTKIFQISNKTQYQPQNKPLQSLMQKIVIVNHQGRPQTYYMK
ncbi:unnamed protein product [Paramecium sonneborni]|uniref:Uncharacterized protein n=1 Tax=Paramecium sonneborni TaxID=65129 RepID=A0A8S1KPC4_9CILI|nr:unnamed protein product [Paramecium sonneborni]